MLASASPRRRELLALVCDAFTVRASDVDETLGAGPIDEAVAALALRKAAAVAADVGEGVVLGADTVVVVDGMVLGKPADDDDAREMLRRLRGRGHEVITGIAVVDAATRRSESVSVVSRVFMAPVSDEAIDRYVATGEPRDKAGAYAIQGGAADFVVGVIGSYSNVVGMPLEATRRLLARFGVPVSDRS